MTSTDPDRRPAPGIARVLLVAAASLVVLFAAGMIAGMLGAASEHEGDHSTKFYLILIGVLAVAAGAVWLIVRNRSIVSLPASPRMRKSRMTLYACLVVGAISGAAMVILLGPEQTDFRTLFASDAPISPLAALVLLGALVVTTGLSLRWHLLLDEHERAAYDFGGVASLYVYFVLSVGWWLLGRGGLAPAPDGYAIFWAVMITWAIAWLVRRYR